MESLSKIVGANIKYYRFQKKLSQETLSESLDLSMKYISDVESGKYNLSLSSLEKLGKLLGVAPYKFLMPNPKAKKLPSRVDLYWKSKTN